MDGRDIQDGVTAATVSGRGELERRAAGVPVGGLFVGVEGVEDGFFVEGVPASRRLSAEKPQGTDMAGKPVMFQGRVYWVSN